MLNLSWKGRVTDFEVYEREGENSNTLYGKVGKRDG